MYKNGFCLIALLSLTGCGMTTVQGNWVLRDVTPPEATGHFDIAEARLNPDGTYIAKVRRGDRVETARGTYTYEDWGRQLTLRSGGVERTYTATIWFGVHMRVEGQTPDGKPLTAVLA